VFRGTHEQTIDGKGRVNIPAKFRDVLRELGDDRIFITNLRVGDSRCLEGRPYSEWVKIEARIAQLTNLSPAAMAYYDDFYLSGAHDCQIDSQGRLLVPPVLRTYAGLVKDVVFTGGRGKFRLWDQAKWKPVHEASELIAISEPTVIGELGL
jgi:MraZ protein